MNFYLKSFLAIGIISFFSFSCKSHEIADGGPCSYKTLTSPATIINVDRADSMTTEIQFRVESENGIDTISYSQYFSKFATDADVKKYDLKLGNVFTYETHEIVTGSCSPYYYSLKLEKYK